MPATGRHITQPVDLQWRCARLLSTRARMIWDLRGSVIRQPKTDDNLKDQRLKRTKRGRRSLLLHTLVLFSAYTSGTPLVCRQPHAICRITSRSDLDSDRLAASRKCTLFRIRKTVLLHDSPFLFGRSAEMVDGHI